MALPTDSELRSLLERTLPSLRMYRDRLQYEGFLKDTDTTESLIHAIEDALYPEPADRLKLDRDQ